MSLYRRGEAPGGCIVLTAEQEKEQLLNAFYAFSEHLKYSK